MAKIKFEDQMNKLQDIVSKLESGKLDMDEAIKYYEEGLKISKDLNEQLKKFKTKIEEIGNSDDK